MGKKLYYCCFYIIAEIIFLFSLFELLHGCYIVFFHRPSDPVISVLLYTIIGALLLIVSIACMAILSRSYALPKGHLKIHASPIILIIALALFNFLLNVIFHSEHVIAIIYSVILVLYASAIFCIAIISLVLSVRIVANVIKYQ